MLKLCDITFRTETDRQRLESPKLAMGRNLATLLGELVRRSVSVPALSRPLFKIRSTVQSSADDEMSRREQP